MMFARNPLLLRITLAKSLGLLYGLVWFFTLPAVLPEADPLLRWGVLGWFITLGGIVGMAGLFDRHPLWPALRLAWWARGSAMGAWMGLLLLLVAAPSMAAIGKTVMQGVVSNPWWLILEAAIVGAVIDYLCTRAAGEGAALRNAP